MSLLNITNKYILYELFIQIPIKRRLAIINNSKAYYNRLEYLPLIKSLYNKLSDYIDKQIDKHIEKKHNNKENELNILSFDLILDITYDMLYDKMNKFKKEISNNFNELINELLYDKLNSKNIYLLYDNFNYLQNDIFKSLKKYNYYNNIINFNNSFCEKLTEEFKSFLHNNNKNKIFGINIIINDIKINNLYLLNKIFNNIRFLKLDFSCFFNEFNDIEMGEIFLYLSAFVKENPIEIFYFKDDTERTLLFVEYFQKFTKNFIKLDKFYMKKNFKNSITKKLLYEAYQNDNEEIVSKIEDPNLILQNYLMNINNKINLLNLNISNPCTINGKPSDGSFYSLATPSEEFSPISKFQNLEEFVLLYDWPGDYYNNFDENKSLITALNSIKTLKKVIFKEYDFLLKTLSEIKVENAYYINNSTFDSETCYYRKKIIDTEMLNNIKNIEIKIMDECFYKNKTIKFALYEDNISRYFFGYNFRGLKNIEELYIKIKYHNLDNYNDEKKNYFLNFSNIILEVCKQNNHMKKIVINYISYDLCEILKILNDYCQINNTMKSVELFGKIENSNINILLGYIKKIKNNKVDTIVNILDNKTIGKIVKNKNIIKGKISFELIDIQLPLENFEKNSFVKMIKLK